MNLIQLIDCSRDDDDFLSNNFDFIVVKNFDMAENIRGFFENLFVILFFEYYCYLNFLSIT